MIIDLNKFIEKEKPYWIKLEGMLSSIENDSSVSLNFKEIQDLHYLYSRASSGLSKIQTYSTNSDDFYYLNNLVSNTYSFLYSEKIKKKFNLINFILLTFPSAFRRHLNAFIFATLVFLTGGLLGGGIILLDYDAKAYLMPFSHLLKSPSERVKEEKRTIGNNKSKNHGAFASMLMTHNTKVALLSMALGLTLGLGTLALTFYNGVMLGAVAVDYILHNETVFLLGWLLPHGVIEIPALLIASQAGFIFASRQLNFKNKYEKVADKIQARKDLLTLMGGTAIMLVWAGLIESFLSQYHEPTLPYSFKIGFGIIEFTLLILLLMGVFSLKLKKEASLD
ncbi:MAG: hypothetical protein COA79_02705 [Planctomycetota bacterium]|nr:MAG: hypothetical protein COA79_02705 [Planctomycetota bacterium]